MKNLVSIIGVAVIATALFFNTNLSNKSELALTDLITINTANAEDSDWFSEGSTEDCIVYEYWWTGCCGGGANDGGVFEYAGTKTVCELAWTWDTCYNTDCSQ